RLRLRVPESRALPPGADDLGAEYPASTPVYEARRVTHPRRAHPATPRLVPAQSLRGRVSPLPRAPTLATSCAFQPLAPGALRAAHHRGMHTDSRSRSHAKIAMAPAYPLLCTEFFHSPSHAILPSILQGPLPL